MSSSFQERSAPLPPPALRDQAIPGLDILEEAPPTQAVLLWEAYRIAHQWTSADRPRRAGLIDAAAEHAWLAEVMAASLPPEREDQLLLLGTTYRDPINADRVRISLALRSLSNWAADCAWPRTAALLAEAAAHATPYEAGAAHQAGRYFVQAGWEDVGAEWFHYGLSVARSTGILHDSALFLDSLGEFHYRRGNLRQAERLHRQALGVARRGRARMRAAAALHNLSIIAGERGDLERAGLRARHAARLYGPEHPTLPALLHDLAYLWMLHGRFAAAQSVIAGLLPHLKRPQTLTRAQANLARASAGAGDRASFEAMWTEVTVTFREATDEGAWTEALGDALSELAHAALFIGEPGRAIWAVDQALPLLRSCRRSKELLELEGVREAAEAAMLRAASADRSSPVHVADPATTEIAEKCVELLSLRTVGA